MENLTCHEGASAHTEHTIEVGAGSLEAPVQLSCSVRDKSKEHVAILNQGSGSKLLCQLFYV